MMMSIHWEPSIPVDLMELHVLNKPACAKCRDCLFVSECSSSTLEQPAAQPAELCNAAGRKECLDGMINLSKKMMSLQGFHFTCSYHGERRHEM